MDSFKSLIGPVKVLDIEFSGSSIRKNELNVVPLNIDASGQANAIFFWWDIKMNPSGTY